jgi:hypothetical protein
MHVLSSWHWNMALQTVVTEGDGWRGWGGGTRLGLCNGIGYSLHHVPTIIHSQFCTPVSQPSWKGPFH